jgi:prophage regulatory protein
MTAADLATADDEPVAPLCLLRLPQVKERTGMGRSMIYEAIKAGTFVAPIRLGRRCVAWPSDAVNAWVRDRIAQSRVEPRR